MSNLDLVDWALAGRSAVWLLGLSVVLACLSFGDFEASRHNRRLREVLAGRGYQRGLNVGLMLFSLGLMASSRAWWEAVIWGLLAAVFAYQVWRTR